MQYKTVTSHLLRVAPNFMCNEVALGNSGKLSSTIKNLLMYLNETCIVLLRAQISASYFDASDPIAKANTQG